MKIPVSTAVALGCLVAPVLAASESPAPTIWAAGPLEVRVAFPDPVRPSITRGLTDRAIDFGEGERAGRLRIGAARLEDGGRTLVLATDPHPWEATYRLTLPGVRPLGAAEPAKNLPLIYALDGVEASWSRGQGDARPDWAGWWPNFDTEALRALASRSAEHRRALDLLAQPGRLTLRALVRLPGEKPSLTLKTSAPFEATFGGEAATASADGQGMHRATLAAESTGDPLDLSVTLTTGAGDRPATLRATNRTEAGGDHPLRRDQLILPWAQAPPPASPALAEPPFPLLGGDPSRGETAFFSEEAKCSACHKVRGRGGDVGPALDDLAGQDRTRVYREIADPSAWIHPEFVSYTITLKDGGVAVGIVRAEGADAIRVLDTNAKTTTIKKSDIDDLRPSSTSIMPVGLAGALGEKSLRDLIAFLTAPKAAPEPDRRK